MRSRDIEPFPIQGGGTVPMWLARIAYREYARVFGKQQSIERLGQRGGFGRLELIRLLRGRCTTDDVTPEDRAEVGGGGRSGP